MSVYKRCHKFAEITKEFLKNNRCVNKDLSLKSEAIHFYSFN